MFCIESVNNTPTDTSSTLSGCITPPPMYTSLPRIEISEVDEVASASTSQNVVPKHYDYNSFTLQKHLSLEELHAPLRQRQLSLDINRVKLYNAIRKSQAANDNPPEVVARGKRKRRFSSISETHLLLAIVAHDDVAFESSEGVKNLRRSVSIENLFTL